MKLPNCRTALRAAASIAIVVLVSLVALEFLARTFIFDPTQAYIRTPGWRMIVRTNDLLPHVTGDHVITINELGLRGEPPRRGANPLIAVLGGSTTEDWVLPDERTWPKQLEASIRSCSPRAWAGNLGKGGVNARHHLIQLPEIMKYMPEFDTYVVLLGLNDFLFDLRIHHPFELPKDWWRQQALMSDAGDEGRIALVAIAKRLYKIYSESKKHPPPASDFGHYQDSLRAAYRKVRPEQWVDEMPDLTKHLAAYRDTILRLKAFADSRGKPIYFVSQPFLWSDHMNEVAQKQIYAGFIGSDMNSPQTKWYTPRALERGLDAYNKTLMETCRERDLICVDAASALPREPEYFYDEFHFSTAGAARIGEIVGNAIKQRTPRCQ